MKQINFKHLLASLVALLVSMNVNAHDAEINGIYYNLVKKVKQATVTYQGDNSSSAAYSGSVTIPSTVVYEGVTYDVTNIGHSAFYKCSRLTSVNIPSSVTSIGEYAFAECRGLSKAEFTSIEHLFQIEFKGSSSNPLCYAHHLYINGEEVTEVIIPSTVTSIECAFCGCSGLTSVTIPSSVTSIGSEAFYRCSGLTSVNIPTSVTNIGWRAFCSCSGLTSVTIPSSVTSIGRDAFEGCTGLTSVIISEGVTSIEDGAFDRCTGLTSIVIPLSVTRIRQCAFYGCTGLTSVTIPSSVTTIEGNAFYGCTGLTSVTIEGNPSICSKSFANCPELTDIYCYSENPPSVESNAFEGSYIDYVTLHVPAEYIDNYKNHSFWGNSFKEIVAIDPNSVVMPKVEGESPVAYDLNGRRVSHPTSGLYIVNGKKVYVR